MKRHQLLMHLFNAFKECCDKKQTINIPVATPMPTANNQSHPKSHAYLLITR